MYLPNNLGDDLIPLFFATTTSRSNNGEEKKSPKLSNREQAQKTTSIPLRIEAVTAN